MHIVGSTLTRALCVASRLPVTHVPTSGATLSVSPAAPRGYTRASPRRIAERSSSVSIESGTWPPPRTRSLVGPARRRTYPSRHAYASPTVRCNPTCRSHGNCQLWPSWRPTMWAASHCENLTQHRGGLSPTHRSLILASSNGGNITVGAHPAGALRNSARVVGATSTASHRSPAHPRQRGRAQMSSTRMVYILYSIFRRKRFCSCTVQVLVLAPVGEKTGQGHLWGVISRPLLSSFFTPISQIFSQIQ